MGLGVGPALEPGFDLGSRLGLGVWVGVGFGVGVDFGVGVVIRVRVGVRVDLGGSGSGRRVEAGSRVAGNETDI